MKLEFNNNEEKIFLAATVFVNELRARKITRSDDKVSFEIVMGQGGIREIWSGRIESRRKVL